MIALVPLVPLLTGALGASGLCLAPAVAGSELLVEWAAPSLYVEGMAYRASVTLTTEQARWIPAWMLSPSVFEVDGEPLGEREDGQDLWLAADSRLTLESDLAPYLRPDANFELGCAGAEIPPTRIVALEPAGELDFLAKDTPLEGWLALHITNRGTMLFELWPDVAPEHVRNFLELCHSGYYDGICYHRIVPGFMIQAGCPYTKDPQREIRHWGQGTGPRIVEAEFNDRQHLRGVLSMARMADIHSASSQFFVCQSDSVHLDGQYTAFGRVVEGIDTVDRIARAAVYPNSNLPMERQRIEQSLVVRPITPRPATSK